MSLVTHAVTGQSIVRMRQRPNPYALPYACAAARQCDTGGAASARRRVAVAFAAGLVLWGLCASASAQEANSPGAVVGDVLDALHLRQEPPAAADFVVRSRPAPGSLDYQPMKPTEKSEKKKTPAQLDALGAELESALAQNRRAGARVAAPDPAPRPAPRRAAGTKPPQGQAN